MCSWVCPCNLDFSEEREQRDAWLDILTDENQVAKYDRCIQDPMAQFEGTDDCDNDRAIITYTGEETTFDLTGYDLKAYSTFEECFTDLMEGERDTE